jgi:hypothetical protein
MAFLVHFFETQSPDGHSLKQPKTDFVDKFLSLEEIADGSPPLIFWKGRGVRPRLPNMEGEGKEDRESQKVF